MAVLGRLGAISVVSRAVLGALGAILVAFGANLERSWPLLGRSWSLLGLLGAASDWVGDKGLRPREPSEARRAKAEALTVT